MERTAAYASPLGEILLAADPDGVTGLWFREQKYFARGLSANAQPGQTPALAQAAHWLDCYFAGSPLPELPPLHPRGTPFQMAVWALLRRIPLGQTATYGTLAARLAADRGAAHLSAQAVGSAVGRNPISILIPCHRVVGADGSLTGYAGGLQRKAALLRLEGGWQPRFFLP